MHASRLRLALAVALLPFACDGLDTFEVVHESTATVPGATILETLAGDLGFGDLVSMDLADDRQLKNQGVERHEIDSVRLGSLALAVIDPSEGQDLTFLERLEFFVESEGLPRKRIAHGGPFPAGERRVELDVDDVELAPYAAADAMSVTTEVSGRRPPRETTLKATLTLLVDVNVSGAACGG